MWHFENNVVTEPPEGALGFIYRITNQLDGRWYIGCKKFWFQVTKPPLKGQKRKRRSVKESDWQEYFGSSEHLKADVEEFGRDNFERQIIRYCFSKAELSYHETKTIFETDALISEQSYNRYVSCRVNSNQLGIKKR